MNFQCYIAMTAAEYNNAQILPQNTAWMACHFSCYGTGLSNLPPKSADPFMLIINDKLPPAGHDPDYIVNQLFELKKQTVFSCILLDFQRERCPKAEEIARHISHVMDCPVGISEAYAHCGNGPVFLNCPSPHCALSEKIAAWQDRELWLEVALEGETALIYRDHCDIVPNPTPTAMVSDAICEELNCRYRILDKSDHAELVFYRDRSELQKLIYAAKHTGVTKVIGLFQQLGSCFMPIE